MRVTYRLLRPLAAILIMAACSSSTTSPSAPSTSTPSTSTPAPVTLSARVTNLTWDCSKGTSATPLPGWRGCAGVASVVITGTLTSNVVSAFYDFPDTGSFFHGEASASTGTVNINTVNEYVSKCQPSYTSSVKIYDGNQLAVNAGRATLIGTASITMTSTCT